MWEPSVLFSALAFRLFFIHLQHANSKVGTEVTENYCNLSVSVQVFV